VRILYVRDELVIYAFINNKPVQRYKNRVSMREFSIYDNGTGKSVLNKGKRERGLGGEGRDRVVSGGGKGWEWDRRVRGKRIGKP